MNEALSQLADDFFKNSLNSSPTSAIMRGYKEYFDQIEELTETKFDQDLRDLEKFEKRLDEIDFNNLSNKLGVWSWSFWIHRLFNWLQPANVYSWFRIIWSFIEEIRTL